MSDKIPPEPKTLDDNEIPVDWGELPDPYLAQEKAKAEVFAGIVGEELDKRLSKLTGAINDILAFAQDLKQFRETQEQHSRDIAGFKAWQRKVNEHLGWEAAE